MTFSAVVPQAPAREMAIALGLLRYTPSATPIRAVDAWPNSLHPDRSQTGDLLALILRAGLLHAGFTAAEPNTVAFES